MKKLKKDVVFSVDRFGKGYEGTIDNPFYDVVRENNDYVVYYYGMSAVYRGESLDAAKKYLRDKLTWQRILEPGEDIK